MAKSSSGIRVQKFGGPWSLIKVDLVDKYLKFFNTALKNQPFERVYIDAFAGSGAFKYAKEAPLKTLFGERDETDDIHDGSAIRALRANPPFHRIRFIESKRKNVKSLEKLIAQTSHPDAKVITGDANEALKAFCDPRHWKKRRGVIFLDPFGMNVNWEILRAVADTKALDVWLLFPLGATVRNLPKNASALDKSKRDAVTRIFGTEDWYKEFYEASTPPTRTLFGNPPPEPPRVQRVATVNQVESFARKRLETIFKHVEPPKRLKGPKNQSLFSLFFAISSPSSAAITVGKKGAAHILKS
jgi:three-Cys-motif partner protein